MADADREAGHRPDPDALLALPGQGIRGRLTVFLGAAPGVGKTYAMLARARRLRADGVDIVIGLVETHGRAETAAFLEGMEILPRRQVAHRGAGLDDFDLDAALLRRPRILVVDELAHTNAPGSRHPKRYQDVEELLDAGIDVWSAVNIQHIESLADVVAQITGVQVRERVPDTMLSRADEVVLIDLSPAELLDRLREGKVYVPENARRAAENFFTLGNLTALREMALRRTADRVDDQVIDYLKQNAIEGAWATAERLLVCIGPDPLSEKVVRTAARLASSLNAQWLVVSIERADQLGGSAGDRLDRTFRLAASLGAETRRVSGNDFVEEIMRLARREHATQIVIGARRQRFPASLLKTSLTDALIARVSGIAIHVVTDATDEIVESPFPPVSKWWKRPVRNISAGLIATLLATLAGYGLEQLIDLPNVGVIFLLGVLLAAMYGGYVAALTAALLSALAYNFLFIEPLSSFTIAQPHEVVGFLIFIGVALLAGGLASRIADQAQAARSRARDTQRLYDFSRSLSAAAKADDVIWAAVSHIRASFGRGVTFLLHREGDVVVVAAWPPDTELDLTDMAAARWAFARKEPAGYLTETLPGSAFQFHPLTSPSGTIGVIGLQFEAGKGLSSEEQVLLRAILDQTAIAIDRARLSEENLDQTARQEGERFRSALLSSISHDLKTPLATITGAVTTLRELGGKMSPSSRDDLLLSIEQESERLTRFVSNLLDMTRIEAGTVNPKREWVDVADVVRSTLERAVRYFPDKSFETSIAPDLPLIRGDSILLSQALFNLVDNAVKYGGDEPVTIYARPKHGDLVLSVTDLGKGIPSKDIEHVFEKFFRRGKSDQRKPGTGLGLAIAKGFVEAMGGRIRAESPAQRRRGTRITLSFPIDPPPGSDHG